MYSLHVACSFCHVDMVLIVWIGSDREDLGGQRDRAALDVRRFGSLACCFFESRTALGSANSVRMRWVYLTWSGSSALDRSSVTWQAGREVDAWKCHRQWTGDEGSLPRHDWPTNQRIVESSVTKPNYRDMHVLTRLTWESL